MIQAHTAVMPPTVRMEPKKELKGRVFVLGRDLSGEGLYNPHPRVIATTQVVCERSKALRLFVVSERRGLNLRLWLAIE